MQVNNLSYILIYLNPLSSDSYYRQKVGEKMYVVDQQGLGGVGDEGGKSKEEKSGTEGDKHYENDNSLR